MTPSKISPKTKKKTRVPLRSSEVPVTQAMLYGVRDELKEFTRSQIHGVKSETYGIRSELKTEINDLRTELKSEISGLRTELKTEINDLRTELKTEINDLRTEVKTEINGLGSEVHGLRSEIEGVKSDIHGLKSDVHKLTVLIEEQNARNIIVLDGLTGLFGRQEKVETRVDGFEKLMLDLKRAKSSSV